MEKSVLRSIFHKTVVVSALGYFVDIYDLILFSIVSLDSLRALGVTDQTELRSTVGNLLSWQMGGMLIGGFLWGILGDKRGRLSVLFGSIALYSIANIANAFVTTVPMYAFWRFVAGVGLAGELGAAVTLVSEVLQKELRGYGTAIVAAVGIMGAVVGGLVARYTGGWIPGLQAWQVAYIVGGVLGIALLITRITMAESLIFKRTKLAEVSRGSLLMLFGSGERASRFLRTTLVGLPIWCLIAIFITLSPFVGADLGVTGAVTPIYAVMWYYALASLGGLFWGFLSQAVKSRKKVCIAALTYTGAMIFVYFFATGISPALFYLICGGLGFGSGYWSVFVTMAAEQFGTNLRATVATTVPNLIRGTVVPLTIIFNFFAPSFGLARTAMVMASLCVIIALLSVRSLAETITKDLNYVETGTPLLDRLRRISAGASDQPAPAAAK